MRKFFVLLLMGLILSCWHVCAQQVEKMSIQDLLSRKESVNGPLIINFWATWCHPCVEEIPYFQQYATENGVSLWLVSLDLSEDVEKIPVFAQQHGFDAPIYWLNETNADYFCPKIDPSWSGALPASLFVNKNKAVQLFSEGQLSREELQEKIKAIL